MLKMDEEDNQKRDDADEILQNKLRIDSLRNASGDNTECDSLSQQGTRLISDEVFRNLEKKRKESGTNKRPLSGSPNLDTAEAERPENISRKRKLMSSTDEKDSDRKLHKVLAEEEGSIEAGAVKIEGLAGCHDDNVCNSNFMCPHCDFKCADGAILKIHKETKHSQEVSAAVPETLPSSEEISVDCRVENMDKDIKGKTHDQFLPSCSDLENHMQESHCQQSKEQRCPRCSCTTKCNSALHTHAKQDHEKSKIFCCDLCGFQSAEENLLNSHLLSKTHLRRQNLAARGGFVQILTKKSFKKTQSTATREKNVRARPGSSKLKARTADAKELNVCSALEDSNVSLSKQNDGTELLAEMIPSTNIPDEKTDKVMGKLLSSSVEGDNEVHTEKLEIPGPSDFLQNSEFPPITRKLVSSLNVTKRFDRLEHKRNIVLLRAPFGGNRSFRLKRQVKRRYNLLGKRSKSETRRAYMKHISSTQLKPSDSSPTSPTGLETNDKSHCNTMSEIQDLTQGKPNTLSSSTTNIKNSEVELTADPSVHHTCIDCGHVFQNKESLEIHVVNFHTKSIQFLCQTCSYSCGAKEDLQQHCQNTKHQMGSCSFNCQLCSFTSLNVINFQSHMTEVHNMSHSCPTCVLFFQTQEELINHQKDEKHDSSLFQQATPLSNSSLTLQVVSYSDSVSNSSQKLAKETKISMKTKPLDSSTVNQKNELKHSVLSKTQFQCKKCFYKTRSSTVLTRHIKLRHAQGYHFLCKACNLYSLSKEGMEKHIKRT